MRRVSDSVLLSGWLFADLLLGLMIIFMVSIPGVIPHINNPPRLIVKPSQLDPNSPACTGGITQPVCTVKVQEATTSDGDVNWSVKSDFSNNVVFSMANGILRPGKSTSITISSIACQSGSFIFSGSNGAVPVVVLWKCMPLPVTKERLDYRYKEFGVTVHDINGLLNNSPSVINDIKQQVRSQSVLEGRSVGIAIVYGGAPSDPLIGQADQIATKVYIILGMLGNQGFAFQRASYYAPLYVLGADLSSVKIDVYLFKV